MLYSLSGRYCVMDEPETREGKMLPWWIWLLVVLFPIPFGVVRWWVAIIFIAVFVVLIWTIMRSLRKKS